MAEQIFGHIGEFLLQKQGGKLVQVNTKATLQGKTIVFYFSAHWCGPSKKFTPILSTYCETLMKQIGEGKREANFEFVFVTQDHNAKEFEECFTALPAGFYAVEYGKQHPINQFFSLEGIPTVATFDAAAGVIINKACEMLLKNDPEGANFPYGSTSSSSSSSDSDSDEEVAKCAPPRATSVVQSHLADIRAAAAAGNFDLVIELTTKMDEYFRQTSGRCSRLCSRVAQKKWFEFVSM